MPDANGNGNGGKNWLGWVVVSLQSITVALIVWTLKTVVDHETRISVVEEWKGDESAYTPSDAEADAERAARERARIVRVQEGHAERIRRLEILMAQNTDWKHGNQN